MMNRYRLFFVLIILLSTAVDYAWAQRHVERFSVINPLNRQIDDDDRRFQWMTGFSGWGEFGKYTIQKDTDHEWHHQIGAVMEMVRINDRNSIAFATQAEFVYDPHNDINFNPRAIFWEEGLIFTRKLENFDWQLAYYHRCKHDIDNLESGKERTTINGSFSGRIMFHEIELPVGKLSVSPGIDLYTITYDRRDTVTFDNQLVRIFPDSGINWYNLLGAINTKLLWRTSLSRNVNFFVSAYGKATAFSDERELPGRYTSIESVYLNGAVFAGLEISGNADFRIGLRAEHLADTGVPLNPKRSNLLSLTIQAKTPDVIY